MNLRFRLSLLALLLIPAPSLAQQARDFQLPPSRSPTADPDVQGPVDTDGVVPVRPRAIPTPAPTSTEPPGETVGPPIVLPTPLASPEASEQQREAGPANTPAPQGRTPAPIRQDPVQQAPARQGAPPPANDTPTFAPDSVPEVAQPPIPPPIRLPEPPVEAGAPETETDWPLWAGVAGALGLAALGGLFVVRRRRGAAVRQIERPTVGAAPPAPIDALNLRVEALKLSRSVMNATLFYRVTVLNRSQSPLSQVSVEADLTSAHGEAPMEQQVAGLELALEERHQRDRLAAGQSARFEGQIVLPLAQARLLRQGRLALLVPLLRLRATAAGVEPVAKTLAIGPAASGGGDRLVPFRLDEGPRSYEPLAQKAIA